MSDSNAGTKEVGGHVEGEFPELFEKSKDPRGKPRGI